MSDIVRAIDTPAGLRAVLIDARLKVDSRVRVVVRFEGGGRAVCSLADVRLAGGGKVTDEYGVATEKPTHIVFVVDCCCECNGAEPKAEPALSEPDRSRVAVISRDRRPGNE